MPNDLNIFAIVVGNTRTRIGTFVADKLTDHIAVPHDEPTTLTPALHEAYAPMRELEGVVTIMASNNPTVAGRAERALTEKLGLQIHHVERDVPVPIGRQLDPEAIVGDDRLLNAAGAFGVLKQACVIVDAGTAITVDCVDGAGTFHGGAIAPGARMMLAALHEHTALLPEIELAAPVEPIGHNTVDAMRSGIYHGLRGMVRELVEQYAEVLGAFPMVIATGGDAELLFNDFELIDRVVPDLTLLGMAATVRAAIRDL